MVRVASYLIITFLATGFSILPSFFFFGRGTIRQFTIDSSVLQSTRIVEVYLPPSYAELGGAGERYPVLFMQDGQNLFSDTARSWQLNQSLDLLLSTSVIRANGVDYSASGVQEMIVVAPHSSQRRIYEYTPTNGSIPGACNATQQTCGGGADLYLDFLETELLPKLELDYQISRHGIGIAGSSLGGLVALYACWSRPNIYSRCGSLSPSLWWDEAWMLQQIEMDIIPLRDRILYMDSGTEQDSLDNKLRLYNILVDQTAAWSFQDGKDLLCLVGQGHRHSEDAWRIRAPFAVSFLFQDPARAEALQLPKELVPCSEVI